MLRYQDSVRAPAVFAAVLAWMPACGQGVAVESDSVAEHRDSLDRACPTPGRYTGDCPVRAISAGGYFTCALLTEGSVKCWGESAYGDLGLGDEKHRGVAPDDMGARLPPVDLGAHRVAQSVAAGFAHVCALLDDGRVKCWGHNSVGQLGLGDSTNRGDGPGEMGDALPAVDLGTGKSVHALSAGGDHTCALFEGGYVKCWGFNYSGQLGLGDRRKRGVSPGDMGAALPFVDLGPGRTARAISAGGSHTCALLDDGSVKCWGDNSEGALGLGDRRDRGGAPGEMGSQLPAVDLGPGREAVSVAAGWDHTCALLDNGSVKCWGHNDLGQLGLGHTHTVGDGPGEMGVHLRTVDLGDDLLAIAISAGVGFSCAVTTGGVKCWGDNEEGRLGLGDTKNRGDLPDEMGNELPFVDLGTGVQASALSLGAMHACALVGRAGVKCWGDNYDGQLGLGNTNNRGDDPGEMGDALPPVDLGNPD